MKYFILKLICHIKNISNNLAWMAIDPGTTPLISGRYSLKVLESNNDHNAPSQEGLQKNCIVTSSEMAIIGFKVKVLLLVAIKVCAKLFNFLKVRNLNRSSSYNLVR